MRQLLAAAGFSALTVCAHASSELRFTELAGQDFQRLGTINDFHQDGQGFIWLAGAQGLARFDGHDLTLFADAKRPDSAQYIWAIQPDPHNGALWLASETGLGRLSPARDDLRMLRAARFSSQLGFHVDPATVDAIEELRATLRIVSAPRSMFRRIRKLPPAHYLVFEHGRVQVRPYWVPRFAPKRIGSLSSAVDEIEYLGGQLDAFSRAHATLLG